MVKRLCAALLILSLATVVSRGPEAGEKPALKWSFASTVGDETHPTIVSAHNFAKALEEATNGRWTMDVYPAATLGTEQEAMEMLRTNTVTMSAGNICTGGEMFMDEFGVFGLPYLFRSWEDFVDYVWNSPNGQELRARLEKNHNVRLYNFLPNGQRCLATSKIPPVKRPSDLKNVRIRSQEPEVWQDVIRALGGTPIPVNFAELYMALQTGVVNGQDNPMVLLYSQRLYEVQDDFYRTDHWYNHTVNWINPQAYDSLDAEDKALCDRLTKEILIDQYNELLTEYEKTAEAAVRAKGVRIWEKNEIDINAFYASADELINSKYLTRPIFAKYINDIRQRFNYK